MMTFQLLLRTIGVAVLLIGTLGTDAEVQDDLIHTLANLTNVLLKERQKGVSCPFPFTGIMYQCFFVSNHGVSLDFNDARKFCRGMGGELAQPKHPNALRVYILEKEAGKNIYDRSSSFKIGARIPDDAFWKIQSSVFSSVPELPQNIRDANMRPRNNMTWINGDIVEVQQLGTVERGQHQGPDGQQGVKGDDCLYLMTRTDQYLPYYANRCNDKTPFICEYVM